MNRLVAVRVLAHVERGHFGHLVNRAIPIVFFFFHVRQPGPVARDVTGVCACSGVSGYDRIRQRSVIEIVRKIRIADYSAKPAVADALKLTVPVVRRHPYFDLDIRGGARFERRVGSRHRQPQSARPLTSFRQPKVASQATHDTLPGTQSSAPQQTTVPMSAPPVPDMSTVPVFEQQHHTPGATSAHDNAAVDRTPTWSGTSGFIWDPLPHAAFGDLLTYQFS